MKKAKKVLALAVCAVMLVGVSVAGTLAWMTSKATVTNEFTVGNVGITMVESVVDEYGNAGEGTTDVGNTYKLIPGHVYTKDPVITVSDNSENCYLFVKIENQLEEDVTIFYSKKDAETPIEFTDSTEWTNVSTSGNTSVWAYVGSKSTSGVVAKKTTVPVFGSFEFANDADPTDHVNNGTKPDDTSDDVANKIIVTAYAIQADGLANDTHAKRWEKLEAQLNQNQDQNQDQQP